MHFVFFNFSDCSITLPTPHSYYYHGYYITSPLYPDVYPKNTMCNYTITYKSSTSYHPVIHFYSFNIKESKFCNEGSVSIYNGKDANGLLLDRLCGSKAFRTYVASTDTLFVQFRTGNVSYGMGFYAYIYYQYSGLCI